MAAEAVTGAGIPIVEVTMTVPGAVEVIAALVKSHPALIVGAGTVWDIETATRCLDAGAMFLTSTGTRTGVVRFAHERDTVVFPRRIDAERSDGGMEGRRGFRQDLSLLATGRACVHQTLKQPFPKVPFIAAGGVNQQNAAEFILAGAAALAWAGI